VTEPAAAPAALAEAGGAALGRLAADVRGPVVGIGVDAVDPERLGRVLDRRPGLAARVFTAAERDRARGAQRLPRLSTRFAAKEAAWKALGVGLGEVGLRDVEVREGADRAPSLALHGRAAALADQAGVRRWHLSLTHTDRVAIAVVVAEGSTGAAAGTVGPSASGD
jgi:holo-[acyl-carrier protein] synthase